MSYAYSIVFAKYDPTLKVLPPAPLNHSLYPYAQTTVNNATLQDWEQSVGQQSALDANSTLAGEYINGEFAQWYSNYVNHGTDPNEAPPQPPLGAMIQVYPNGVQWDLVQIGPQVCSIPAYTRIPPPDVNHLSGLNQVSNSVTPSSPFSKAVPMGSAPVAAPDGSLWVRVQ